MPSIIFDTNVYRNIARRRCTLWTKIYFNRLVKKEQKKGYKAYLSPIVLLELMSHLADKKDPHYNVCKRALIGAYIHCKEPDDNYRMLSVFETHLCVLLFNTNPTDIYDEQKRFGNIAYQIYKNGKKFIKLNKNGFNDIKNYIERSERQFVEDMKNEVITPINNSLVVNKRAFREEFTRFKNSGELKEHIALSQLIKTIDILNIDPNSLSDEDRQIKLDYISSHFDASITLYQNLISSILDSNGNFNIEKKKRPNLIWDFQISFCIGQHAILNESVILVTDDKAILKAATDSGNQNSVMNRKDYLRLFKSIICLSFLNIFNKK